MDNIIKHDQKISQVDVNGKKKNKRKRQDQDVKNSVQNPIVSDTTTNNDNKTLDTAEPKEPQTEKKKKKKNKKINNESVTQASSEINQPPSAVVPAITTTPNDEIKTIDTAQSKEEPTEKKKKKKIKRILEENQPPSANSNPQTDASCTTSTAQSAPSNPSPSDSAPTIEKNSQNDQDLKTSKTKKEGKKAKKANKSTNPSQTPSSSTAPITSSNPISSSVTPNEIQQFISSNKLTYEPPEVSSQFPPALRFDDVVVHDSLRKAFVKFQKPSPIQSAVWPVLIAGRDVVGIAETGSGKTLAFGVPALQHILNTSSDKKNKASSAVNVLVVAPTRELAMQTETTLSELGKLTSPQINTLCVYGGVDKFSQRQALSKSSVRVVVGTPGRLLDLANEGILKLDQVSWLILDEADRMLDKGFENDIRAIIGLCLPSGTAESRARLTTMFSATWPTNVRRLAADFMHNPVRILVGADELTASCSVEQTVEVLEETRGKEWKLLSTLQSLSSKNGSSSKDKIIVFALYKKEAQRLFEFLQRKNFQACCIEGNMSQDKRSKALDDFMTGKATILVATDVAARGLDIPKVEFVINVTFPLTIEDYIHRIGRTGRAGRTGKSITFFTEDDKSHAGELIRVLKDAGQVVPEALKQWGGQIKKKTHAAYGDHWKDVDLTVKAQKIKFD